jgi:hypothetical protein
LDSTAAIADMFGCPQQDHQRNVGAGVSVSVPPPEPDVPPTGTLTSITWGVAHLYHWNRSPEATVAGGNPGRVTGTEPFELSLPAACFSRCILELGCVASITRVVTERGTGLQSVSLLSSGPPHRRGVCRGRHRAVMCHTWYHRCCHRDRVCSQGITRTK